MNSLTLTLTLTLTPVGVGGFPRLISRAVRWVGGTKPQPGREVGGVGGWLKKLVRVNGCPEARGVRKNAERTIVRTGAKKEL